MRNTRRNCRRKSSNVREPRRKRKNRVIVPLRSRCSSRTMAAVAVAAIHSTFSPDCEQQTNKHLQLRL